MLRLSRYIYSSLRWRIDEVADMDIDNPAGTSTLRQRDNMVYISDSPLCTTPQVPFNYRSLDSSSDPSISIDNGELAFDSIQHRLIISRITFLACWFLNHARAVH